MQGMRSDSSVLLAHSVGLHVVFKKPALAGMINLMTKSCQSSVFAGAHVLTGACAVVLVQARLGGERDGGQEAPTPAKAGPAARTPLGQQQPAANSKGGSAPGNSTKARGAAAKPAPLPKAPKGCWLDAARGQAAAKRKAQILAVGANKRAALGQGLKATTAAAGADEGSQDAAAAAEDAGGGHNGYTVLYKFNEGYTNAVKRPIKMAELLGLPQ